jgi:hypothetical protein
MRRTVPTAAVNPRRYDRSKIGEYTYRADRGGVSASAIVETIRHDRRISFKLAKKNVSMALRFREQVPTEAAFLFDYARSLTLQCITAWSYLHHPNG